MIRVKSIAFLLVIMALIGACTPDDNDPVIKFDIEDEFEIDMWEDLMPTYRTFSLEITTLAETYCENSTVNANVSKDGDRVIVSIEEIVEPDECGGNGESAAEGRVNLGSLETGFYQLEINLKGTVINKGELIVEFDKYTLRMQTDYGLKLAREELLKVPENALWGYVGYDDPESEDEAAKFVNALRDLEGADFAPGYYGYFTIEDDRDILLKEDNDFAFSKTFLFSNVEEYTYVQDLLNFYRTVHGDKLTMQVYTASGDVF